MESSTTRATFAISSEQEGAPVPSALLCTESSRRTSARQRESLVESYRSHHSAKSGILILNPIFNVHVLELAGFEDLPAFLAFHKFRFLVAAHDLHTRVLARLLGVYVRRRGGRLGGHVIRMVPNVSYKGVSGAGILGIVERLCALSSPLVSPECEIVTASLPTGINLSSISDRFSRTESSHSAQSTYR